MPRSILPDLADDMARISRGQTYRAVIDHPLVKPGSDYRGSIQLPNLKAIAALSALIFPPPGTLPAKQFAAPPGSSASGGSSGVGSCAPAATPTPKPTAKPTAKPTPKPSGGGSPGQSPASSPASSPAIEPSPSPS